MKIEVPENRIAYVTLILGLTVGMWAGVWLVPGAALDVPADVEERGDSTYYNIEYQPVPTYLPAMTVFLSLACIAIARAERLPWEDPLEDNQPIPNEEDRRRPEPQRSEDADRPAKASDHTDD